MNAARTSALLPYVINRNPTNLHRLGITPRPTGYQFEVDPATLLYTFRYILSILRAAMCVLFSYSVELQVSSSNTTGLVRHATSGLCLRACTSDWPLARRLYSRVDVCAAEAVGRVLARQCRRAALMHLYCADSNSGDEQLAEDENTVKQERVARFYRALRDGGVQLSERASIAHVYTPRTPQWYMNDERVAPYNAETIEQEGFLKR